MRILLALAGAMLCASPALTKEFFNTSLLTGKFCNSNYYVKIDANYDLILIGSTAPNPQSPQTTEVYFLKTVTAERSGRVFTLTLDIPDREAAGMYPFSIELTVSLSENADTVEQITFDDEFNGYRRGAAKMTTSACNE